MKPAPGQQSLFGTPRTAREEHDEPRRVELNSTVSDEDAPRLGKQHHAILDRLREGPATNIELSRIGQRFGARLEELKKAGHRWTKTAIEPGVWQYKLADT